MQRKLQRKSGKKWKGLVKVCFKTRLEDLDFPGQAVPRPPGLSFKHSALFSALSLEQTKDLCPRVLWVAGGQRWSLKQGQEESLDGGSLNVPILH